MGPTWWIQGQLHGSQTLLIGTFCSRYSQHKVSCSKFYQMHDSVLGVRGTYSSKSSMPKQVAQQSLMYWMPSAHTGRTALLAHVVRIQSHSETPSSATVVPRGAACTWHFHQRRRTISLVAMDHHSIHINEFEVAVRAAAAPCVLGTQNHSVFDTTGVAVDETAIAKVAQTSTLKPWKVLYDVQIWGDTVVGSAVLPPPHAQHASVAVFPPKA